MSNNSNISPANSTISIAAVAGGGGGSASSSAALPIEDFFPPDPFSFQDRKDEAVSVLRSDLMAALNKVVKSMDDDSWMFEGPRSRIHLVSKSESLGEIIYFLYGMFSRDLEMRAILGRDRLWAFGVQVVSFITSTFHSPRIQTHLSRNECFDRVFYYHKMAKSIMKQGKNYTF